MRRDTVEAIMWASVVLVVITGAALPIQAQDAKAPQAKSPLPSMAPTEQYRMPRDAEIALARTAAPASITRDAEILVMGEKNFETAVQGKNGFVCFVGRAFTGPFTNPHFWNPKNRSPMCYNPPAARTVVPLLMKQAEMALAGFSKTQIMDGIKTAFDNKELHAPDLGSMSYMMSKEAVLQGGGNLSHIMFELPRIDGAAWGADLVGSPGLYQDSPISAVTFDPAPITEFNIPMAQWSDGTDVTAPHSH